MESEMKTSRPTPRKTRLYGSALALTLLLMLGSVGRASWADTCSECPAPSAEAVIAAAGITLETRRNGIGTRATDVLHLDKGECTAAGEDIPEIELKQSYLALSAAGEVWNCPQSQSSSQVSAEIAREHKTDWSLSASVELGLKTPVAEYKARFTASQGGSDGIREVTRLTTTLNAKNCERVPWLAYLRVGTFDLKADFTVTQRWAWWTKNLATAHAVHASGNYMQACGSTTIVFSRKAPLAWHLRLAHRTCCGSSGQYRDLGFHPPLPRGLTPPPWPEEFGYPDPPLPPLPPVDESPDEEGSQPPSDDPLAPPMQDPLAPPPQDPLAPPADEVDDADADDDEDDDADVGSAPGAPASQSGG